MDIAALQRSLREAFRVEAADLLAELDSSMLELESRPRDADLLNRVFRAIHTIKGSGATAGFSEVAAFTHHVEELFDEARMGRLTITREMIDLALQAKDLIGQLLEPDGPAALQQVCTQVVDALAKFLPHKPEPTSTSGVKPGAPSACRQRFSIFFKPHPQVFSSGTDPANLVDELGALGEASVRALVEGVPSLENLNPEQCYLAWQVELLSAQPLGKIKEIFAFVEDESELRIASTPEVASAKTESADPLEAFLNIAGQSLEAIAGFLPGLAGAAEPEPGLGKNCLRLLKIFQAAARHQGQDETVVLLEEQIGLLQPLGIGPAALSDRAQVDLVSGYEKLAALIQFLRDSAPGRIERETPPAIAPSVVAPPAAAVASGPKVEAAQAGATIRVDQEKLDRLMRAAGELLVARNAFPLLAKRLALEHGLSAMSKEVRDAGNHISHIAEDLQAAVMSIRMLPIRSVFQRFPRMVRDICRTQNKEAELVLEGEDTELDKTVIEKIADPLVHLVRNAVDHGVESPEVRALAGKPRAGKVTLKAYNKGNNVVIEVQDDGGGMAPDRLKRKAVEKGLLTPAAAEAMDERAALELIFLPGFTTAEKVTDISGRGVGMDVVHSNIRQLHGTTAIESHLGAGSKITITLPASLMVSKGILVESAGEDYVFPIDSVVQMVRLPRARISRHEQAHFASFRNEVFPVLRLADHFASQDRSGSTGWPEEVPMAIVRTNRGQVGVAVDRFIGHVEVIIKPLGRDFANLSAFQGATIMGDGRIALVINPAGLV